MHLERVCERVNSEDIDLNIKRQADLHVKYMFSDYYIKIDIKKKRVILNSQYDCFYFMFLLYF